MRPERPHDHFAHKAMVHVLDDPVDRAGQLPRTIELGKPTEVAALRVERKRALDVLADGGADIDAHGLVVGEGQVLVKPIFDNHVITNVVNLLVMTWLQLLEVESPDGWLWGLESLGTVPVGVG